MDTVGVYVALYICVGLSFASLIMGTAALLSARRARETANANGGEFRERIYRTVTREDLDVRSQGFDKRLNAHRTDIDALSREVRELRDHADSMRARDPVSSRWFNDNIKAQESARQRSDRKLHALAQSIGREWVHRLTIIPLEPKPEPLGGEWVKAKSSTSK
jgi:hypothetical protein